MVTVFEGIFICYSHLAFFNKHFKLVKAKKRRRRKKARFAEREKRAFPAHFICHSKKQKGIMLSMKKNKKT